METMITSKTAEGHIEALISIGYGKAYAHRFPHRVKMGVERDERKLVGWHLQKLDEAGVPWSIQNNALAFINNYDETKTWDCFYRNSMMKLAKSVLSGKTHSELTK